MAWLSDIAGKAETLLNQLDQGAGVVLQNEKRGKHRPRSTQDSPSKNIDDSSSGYFSAFEKTTAFLSGPVPRSSLAKDQQDRGSTYASSVTSMSKKERDEDLMAFLNDSSVGPMANHPTTRVTEISEIAGNDARTAPLSRRSSSTSLRSLPVKAGQASGSPLRVPSNVQAEPPIASYAAVDRELGDLRMKEVSLSKQLTSKDAQMAILRVKLQEITDQLDTRTKTLLTAEMERERLSQELATLKQSGGRSGSDAYHVKIQQLENELDAKRAEIRSTESDYLAHVQKLESDKNSKTEEVMQLQKGLTDEKIKARDAFDQLKLAKYNLEANKMEFDDYKKKASRILQSKEKLIESLKSEDSGNADGTGTPDFDRSEWQIRFAELEQERDILREDLQQSQILLYNVKTELQEVESQLAAEQRGSLEAQRQYQEQAQTFQHASVNYREQLEQLKHDYQYLQEDTRQQISTLREKLQEKDSEIERLTREVALKSLAPRESELDARIKNLTENLIQKQTQIENLQTDRHSLSLQLERLQRLYQEAEQAAMASASQANNAGGLLSAEEGLVHRSAVPTFLKETPSDSGVTYGVKRAVGGLDLLSLKVAVFLRRFPAARIVLFLYVILLHVWVMIVLLTYTPEIHTSHAPGQPARK